MNQTHKSAILRFLRVYLPQVPAVVAYIMQYAYFVHLPVWVVPGLIFTGAIATALDKLLRDLKWY